LKIEIAGVKNAHIRDGIAKTKFLCWLERYVSSPEYKEDLTEIEAAQRLEDFRKTNEKFVGLSFETISGADANGAIVHYSPSKSKTVNENECVLLTCKDSEEEFHVSSGLWSSIS
jgi:Xaa-Pro aminopeptidase